MGIFTGLFHSRDKPKNSLGSAFSFLFGGTTSGKTVNEHTALQTTAVYACVRILAETIAGLPLHVYQYRSDGSKERFPQHPLYSLLTRTAPNAIAPEDSGFYERMASKGRAPAQPGDILWNFEKFLIGRNGEVINRFSPDMTPDDPTLVTAIKQALAQS